MGNAHIVYVIRAANCMHDSRASTLKCGKRGHHPTHGALKMYESHTAGAGRLDLSRRPNIRITDFR